MIQYSQYKLLSLIQIADIIGGTGIGFIIVIFNTALTLIVIDVYKKDSKQENNIKLKPHIISMVIIILIIISINIYGAEKISKSLPDANTTVSVAQANLPVEYFRSKQLSPLTQFKIYRKLINKAPEGIILLPEGAIATYLRKPYNIDMLNLLKLTADNSGSTIILGTLDFYK